MSDTASPSAPAATPATPPTSPAPDVKATPTPSGQRSNLPPAPKPAPKPSTSPATETEAKAEAPAPDVIEIEVFGKKQTLTKEQAVRRLQKEAAAEKRFNDAANQTKKVQAFLGALEGDQAEEALEHLLGERFDKITEARLARKAQQAMMTPEERERADLQTRLAQYEARERQSQAKAEQAQAEQQSEMMVQHLDRAFVTMAERGNLPSNPETLAVMAEVALQADEFGLNLTEDQLLAEVQDRLDGVSRGLEQKILGGLKGDALLERLGPVISQAVVDATVARFTNGNPYAPPPAPEVPAPPSKPVQYNSHAELQEALRKKGLVR